MRKIKRLRRFSSQLLKRKAFARIFSFLIIFSFGLGAIAKTEEF